MPLTAVSKSLLVFGALAWLSAPAVAACAGRDLSGDWPADMAAEIDRRADATVYGEGRFWSVSKDGATSYLFGTIHLAEDDVATPPAALVDRLTGAEEVLVEVTAEEERRMMRRIMLNPRTILADPDRSLEATLDPSLWGELTALTKGYGITAELADQMAPWYLLITLSNPACMMDYIISGQQILDRRIETVATETGIPVSGLERFEDVFGLFDDISYEDQVALIEAALPTLSLTEDYLETTKSLYKQGRIAAIQAFALVEMEREGGPVETVDAFFDVLLRVRNERWLETLLPKLEAGGRVVAVGAMHLPGEDGLLAALAARGFTVERLPL